MRTQEVSVLQAQNLRCEKGGTELFSNLSFSIQAGQVLVVEGSNGSGKTSLLRIICGFSLPSEGTLTWCGTPIDEHEEFQQQISFVGHQSGVKLDLTVFENLSFAQRLAGTEYKESEIKEIIRKVGLSNQRNILTRKLSAGQKRRVALARIQMEQRNIWVLDEPLTALDREFVKEFELVLKNHLDQQGLLILTTHRELTISEHTAKRLSLS